MLSLNALLNQRVCDNDNVCVIKTLSALKSDIKFTNGELTLLSETTAALQPVKVAREIDLYSADITFQFMLDELAEQKTKISQDPGKNIR
jgi:hypothetical protein